MDKELLISNIIKRCDELNISTAKAFSESGVGKDFVVNLRRSSTTSVVKVAALAAYLGVSTSDLIGDAQKSPPTEIGALYEKLDEVDRAKLLGYASALAAADKYILPSSDLGQKIG